MEDKRFDLFENIKLNDEEKKYFDEQEEVMNIIVKLIKRRLDLKITQRELAEMTGIKQPVIARIERFDATPRLDTLVKIAKALDLRLDFEDNITVKVNANINLSYKIEEPKIDYSLGFKEKINYVTVN